LDELQEPFTTVVVKLAEQLAVVPPLLPTQLHVQGPVPLSVEAVPVVQRPEVGALLKLWPLDELQTPLTAVDPPGKLPPEIFANIHSTSALLQLPPTTET
jgi:hypothetical protein